MFLKNFFILFLMSFFLLQPISARAKHYSSAKIQHYVTTVPRENENRLNTLAAYLIKPFDNDYDKAKAIAFWIASRINYDEYLYTNGKASRLIKNYDGQTPKDLLKSRVGICADFSNLFNALCKHARIRSATVHGYAYPVGRSLTTTQRKNSAHAWNYFIYQNNKIYVDTTFMAKGRTGIKGSQNSLNRERAIKNIQRENQKKSQVNEFDEYYFDFEYKDEKKQRHYIHKEK